MPHWFLRNSLVLIKVIHRNVLDPTELDNQSLFWNCIVYVLYVYVQYYLFSPPVHAWLEFSNVVPEKLSCISFQPSNAEIKKLFSRNMGTVSQE